MSAEIKKIVEARKASQSNLKSRSKGVVEEKKIAKDVKARRDKLRNETSAGRQTDIVKKLKDKLKNKGNTAPQVRKNYDDFFVSNF